MRAYDRRDSLVWENSQLSYVGQDCHKIPYLLSDLYGGKAKRLDLSFNALSSLTGLDGFTALEELILDNNELDDSVDFPPNIRLHTLSLNKNKFKNLEKLLNKLNHAYPNLRFLSLLGNEACPDQLSNANADEKDYLRYKYFVLYKLPKLKFLDSSMITRTDKREAQRVGPYMRIVRPDEDLFNGAPYNDSCETRYSPLPPTDYSNPTMHKGAYGRLRYRYTGKHSEGNRFIRNSHL